MKTYPHLFAKLFCSPLLLIEPVRFSLERELLARMGIAHEQSPRVYGRTAEPHEDTIEFRKMIAATNAAWRVEQIYSVYGNTAVIGVSGVIDKAISDFEMECYGGCDLNDIDQALSLADADPKIERVVLYINSPGGSVTGVPETAARVAAMRDRKEMLARVDVMAASAAYYIASQCDRIDAAPSAVVGSIGVYMALLDQTRALEMAGYKVELIKAGKFKAMGASFKPLTDEERAFLQESVDEIYRDFKDAVVSGRGTVGAKMGEVVSDDVMQGQCFTGKRAVAAGLVDQLVTATMDEYVSALLTGDL